MPEHGQSGQRLQITAQCVLIKKRGPQALLHIQIPDLINISPLLLVVEPLSTDPEEKMAKPSVRTQGGSSFRSKQSTNAKWGWGSRVTLGHLSGRKRKRRIWFRKYRSCFFLHYKNCLFWTYKDFDQLKWPHYTINTKSWVDPKNRDLTEKSHVENTFLPKT